jgi:hypothetical protein
METVALTKMNYLQTFFNGLMKRLALETNGRKNLFSPVEAYSLDAHKVNAWTCFDTGLTSKNNKVSLKIDVACKVARRDSVLDYINELKKKVLEDSGDYVT